MLRRFWRWLMGPPDPSAAPPATLVERVEELEDHVERLERRFVRLQGEFHAVTRAEIEDEEDDAPVFE